MASYKIINDYFGLSQSEGVVAPDELSLNPYWILAVFPFAEEVTYQRSTKSSLDHDASQSVRVEKPLIITSDCIGMQANHSKDGFQGNLQAKLIGGDTDYESSIFPGDWIFAWMLQDEDYALTLVQDIVAGTEPCNEFKDGLKFVGRVNSIRKILTQQPGGIRTVTYNLQASSFTELEASVFFDPDLSLAANQALGNFFAAIGTAVTNFISNGVATTAAALPFLINTYLGTGIGSSLVKPSDQAGAPTAVSGATGPYAFLVPSQVGSLLGKSSSDTPSGTLAAADLDDCLIGIQNYSQGPSDNAPWSIFIPDGSSGSSNHRITGTPISGTFLPSIPQFAGNNNLWTLMYQYLNRAINEMYTCLRANERGNVVPTIVVRQIPFTSDVFSSGVGDASTSDDIKATLFSELPRWVIHPIMVVSADIGRSDAKRCNFVHVYGQPSVEAGVSMPQQIANNPPIQDLSDIKRSGLHPLVQTVACSPVDVSSNSNGGLSASVWMALISDWSMGMHLTMDGTLNVHGIQAPIAPGDNLEFDGVVFHIESVLHTCEIDMGGNKQFYTTMTLTHGLLSVPVEITGTEADAKGIYVGVIQARKNPYDPGLTVEDS